MTISKYCTELGISPDEFFKFHLPYLLDLKYVSLRKNHSVDFECIDDIAELMSAVQNGSKVYDYYRTKRTVETKEVN